MKIQQTAATVALACAIVFGTAAQQRGSFSGALPQRRSVAVNNTMHRTDTKGYRPQTEHRVFPKHAQLKGQLHNATVATPRHKAPQTRVAGDGTTIYGSLLYSSDWAGSTASYGIYSFPAGAYTKPQCVVPIESYDANGGGTYGNGKYYYNSYVYTDEMGYTFSTFCTYDFATGKLSTSIRGMLDEGFDQSQITIDMAFDPTTSRIYALSYISVDIAEGMLYKYYPALSTVDDYTGFVTPIARTPEFIALACSQSGELYGVTPGVDSQLCRINKETADVTPIGPTGLNPAYVQSMCFDPVTDKLYWAEVELNGSTGLYEVDTATGKASLITAFAANEEYGGIYIPTPDIAAGAPGRIYDLAADFTGGSLTGALSFTAPAQTFGGAPLTGELNFTINLDGAESTCSAAAGTKVGTPTLTLTEGLHSATVTASNSAGIGPRNGLSFYVGLDAPEAVSNLKLTANPGGSATVSWDAPEKGRNNGYIDPSKLTYRVLRSDGTLVADHTAETSVTDPVNVAAGNYSYTVIPFCDNREGIEASTQSAMLGSGTSLPATFGFKTAEEFSLFTVIDVNNKYEPQYNWGGWIYAPDDTYTADAGPAAVYVYHPEYDADDWLITPPFTVENGKKYRLTYTMWTKGDKETLAVTAGPQNTVESQSVITPAADYNHKDRRQFTQEFTASSSGNYHVGFHITSKKHRFFLFVTDINIDEVPDENAPAAVCNLTVTPGEKGAMQATISFEAPDATVSGDRLTEIESIEIYRGNDNNSIHTFNSPYPGEKLSWTDANPVQGWNTYRVVAYTAESAGAKQQESAYIGYDLPIAVTNLKAVESSGKVEITWDAPTQGQNGGYVNPHELTYIIYRLGDDEQLLTRTFTGTHYTDDGLDGSRMQHFVYYEVVPVSKTGLGDWALSEQLIFGNPYTGYFSESFADLATHSNPWLTYTVKGKESGWNLRSQGYDPLCAPVDGDGGLATFESTSLLANTEGRLVSPKLDLGSLASPYLSFWMYHNDTSGSGDIYGTEYDPYLDRLIPEILLPDGTYEPLCDPIYADDQNVGTGWVNYMFDLSRFKSKDYVRLSFHGVSKGGQDINVDLVEVFNRLQNDLGIYSLSGPSQLRAGDSAKYRVILYNDGVNTASGFRVNLLVNGNIASTVSATAIAPDSYASVEFPVSFTDFAEGSVITVRACLEWDLDEYDANNTSNVITTKINEALLPEVLELNASVAENKVTLSWAAPNAVRNNDSFEEYSPYDIENIGDYSLLDRDGAITYGFTDIYFPNTGAPQAFMVFNPVQLGISTSESSLFGAAFDPRTGNQVLACFGAYGKANDDWFISPTVHGSQTVRFYAKSGDYAQGVDKYEVLYSTSTAGPAAFFTMGGIVTTGNKWELHEFELPANARYFAIHCVSDDGFVLMIDDLEFIAKRTDCIYAHTGYNLYCNGNFVANLPASATSYITDIPTDGSEQVYTIRATYEGERESGAATAVINPSAGGLDEISSATARVYVQDHDIVVNSPASVAISVINTAGQTIRKCETTSMRHTVVPGIYMVKAGSTIHKVIVK